MTAIEKALAQARDEPWLEYDVNRIGYQIGGGRRRSRVTTLLKGIPKDWMAGWKIKMAAQRVVDDLEGLVDVINEEEPPDDYDGPGKWSKDPEVRVKRWLNAASDMYRDERKDRGKLIHAAVEAVIEGTDMPPFEDEGDEACVEHVVQYLLERDLTILETELSLYSDRIPPFGAAGTTDVWARQPDGRYCLIDWKTSRDVYAEHALQLVFYRNMEFALVGKRALSRKDAYKARPMPWAPEMAADLFAVHVAPDGCTEYQIDDRQQDLWSFARAACHTKLWNRETDSFGKTPRRDPFLGRPRTYTAAP